MKVIAIYNFKGGVGKTAASVNLAYEAARSGQKTLLWDLDPQGASSFYFRIKPKIKADTKKLLKKTSKVLDQIKATDYENLDLLPADIPYREMDIVLDEMKRSKKRFGPLFETLEEEGYETLLIDCPPGLTLVSENAMIASDLIASPIIPTPLSLRAYDQMVSHAKGLGIKKDRFAPFFSMVDRRKSLHREVVKSFIDAHQSLSSVIPYLSSIERMGLSRQPVAITEPRSGATRAYRLLMAEIEALL